MHDGINKIGLGTVQFGIDYGITNHAGQTGPDEVAKILKIAKSENIRILDTARLYGNSEEVLGNSISSTDFKIVTKISPIKKPKITETEIDFIKSSLSQSLAALKTDRIYGLMLHHADDLLTKGAEKINDTFRQWKSDGIVQKTGISVYDQTQIENILQKFDFDIIQIPASVFDQRLTKSGILKKLKEKGVEIHVRSAFLQGILLSTPDTIPDNLEGLKKPLVDFIAACETTDQSQASAALGFLLDNPDIDHIICGVNSAAQLSELCQQAKSYKTLPKDFFDSFEVHDKTLLNPALWKQKA